MEPYFTTTLIIIEIVFSIIVLTALKNASADKKTRNVLLPGLGIIFVIWLAGIYALLSINFFSSNKSPQLTFTAAIVIPVILGLLAQRFWQPFRAAINHMTASSFLALQQMRAVFGVMFFFTASLPLWFQMVGGLGDIAAGLGAFLALRYLRKHPDAERKAIIKGNLPGILDFIIVLNLGVFVVLKTQTIDSMFELIPLYVVPIFILLHIFSLQKLRS